MAEQVDAVDLVDARGNLLLRLQSTRSTSSTVSTVSTTSTRAPSRCRPFLAPRF
jgi:hypothetical protein